MSTAVPTSSGWDSPRPESSVPWSDWFLWARSSAVASTTTTTIPGTTEANETTGSTTATSLTPSTTILTSRSTASASKPGQTASVMTITSVSTIMPAPSSTPSSTDSSGLQASTKIALGAGIASGIVLILLLAIGGFVLGRRTSRSETSEQRGWWGRRTRWRRKERNEIEDKECLEAANTERHELPEECLRHEMATKANVQEMEEMREPVELPGCSTGLRRDLENPS